VGTSDNKFPWRKKATPKLLALEPRMLFDGAAVDASLSLNKEQGAQVVTDAAVTDPVDASSTVQLKIVGDTSALNADSTQTLSLALAQTQQQLLDFANSDRFYSTLEKIYNPTGVDPEGFSLRVEQLRANILGGGLNISVELRSATELAGYLAAYAAVGEDGAEKIYLDKDWVNFGLDQQMVSRALLEEIGHAIDQRLNGKNDTAGDEGEYFSRVVNQDALTTEDVQQLTTEDDHGVALIDGRSIEVEHASITFTKAYQGMNSTYTAVDTTYGIQTSSIYIGSAISSTAYTFQSANPADVQFSGNNVAGQLIYYSGGSKYVYNGLISRPDKTGNTPKALYFAETTVLGGATPTGRAFLLVMPGYEASYSTNQSVSTSSDPIATSLNSVLTSENSNHPPVITSNGGGDNASISFAENTSIATAVTTVTSTDLDAGDTKSFSIYGGADAALFQINSSTGALTFKSSPDYENPLDADRNNLYDVRVMVADSKGATDTQTLTVTVTNVNDNTPVITSNGGGDAASISVPQSTTSVTKVVSTDADVGDVVGYSISGGANSALFSIDASTGQLSFVNAPVYNAGGNNTYYVTVQARDIAGHTDTQALTVTVTNIDNVAPTLAISSDKALLGAGKTATITFTFSEPVQGFTLSDVTVAGGTLTNLVQDPSYPTIYRASFTQSGSSAAPSFSVASGSYQDTSSNNGAAASLTLNYDVVAPTVTVDIAGTDIAFGQTKTVTFTFSEDPSGTFTIGDISPTNGIVTNLLQSSTDSKVFTASIQSTSSTGGPVVVAVAGSYTDAAGNLGSGGQDSATLASPSIDLANTSASDTGSSSVDNITTNQKPVIVGNAPLSETAVTVTVTFGATTLTYNSVAVSNGTWSLDLSSVTPSTGTMPAGGMTEGYVGLTVALTSSSSVTASSSFLIDLTPPSTPTVTAQTATTSTPTIVGTTASDTDVLKVTVNGVTYTSDDGYLSYVKGSTTWSLVIPAVNALSSATYPVTAVAYDLAGKSATDATTNELTVNLNTAAPIVDLAPSDALTLNNTATYTQGGTSVAFAKSGVNISDADSTNLASFTVGYASSSVETGDRFELGSTIIYLASGASSGTVYFNGTYFSYAFTTVGSNAYLQFTSRDSTNSSNAVAATASYEALLDALKFSNDAATFTNNSTRTFSVTANDGSQSSGAATFSITMVAANHAPVLDAAQSPVLTSVSEDSGVPTGATGTLVSSLVSGVSDADTGALKGIAITAINTTNGALYYSTDGGASWSAVGAVSSTSALLLAADGNTRLYYVPSANYNGTVSDALTFSAWDRTSGVAGTKVSTASSGGTSAFSTVTDTVAISVTAVNDAPVASGSATLSDILEDASSPSGATVSSLFAGNFSDSTDSVSGGSSANTLSGIAITSYTADAAKGNWQYTTNGTTWTTIGTVSDTSALTLGVGANDKLRFVPTSNWNGAAPTLSVRLIDSSTTVTTGATVNVSVNGGTTAYSSGTVALSTSVTAVNDAPVASGSATLSDILEDASSPSGATVSSLFAGNFSDSTDSVSGGSSANTLSGIAITSYTADAAKGNWQYTTNGTTWTTIGTVSDTSALTLGVGANDKLRFVPTSNWNGAAPTLSVRLIDSSTTVTTGATVNVSVNGGTTAYSSGTVALSTSVTAVNDAPVAVNDTLSATEDTVVTYTAAQLLSNDTDVDNTNAQLSIASVTSGTGGTAVLNSNGTVTFTPNSNFNGVADFTYTVTDGSLTSNTATVTVNVTAVNDAPVAVNDTLSATEDTVVTYTAAQLLSNDTDVDNTNAQLSIASVTSGTGGTAVLNSNGTVTFTPNSNFNGVADFTYTVTDGSLTSNTATVTVNVTAVNDAPVAVNDTLSATEDTVVTYTAAQLLSNDTDVDNTNAQLSIASVTSGTGGTAVLNANGTVTFTPNSNFNGVADFTYTVTDGSLTSNTATVTVNVTAVNDPPIASDASFSAIKNTVYNGSLPTATDVEGDSVSYASVSGPVHGTLLIDSTGNYSYTPATNYVGSDSFTYVVSDGHGGSNTYTVSVTTVESNHAPVNTVPGTQTVDEDTALLFTGAKTISVSDSDGNLATTKLTVTNGALTVDVSGGAAISTGANGTTTLTLSGTQTQINLALATLSYQGNLNYNGSDTLTVLSSDNAGVPLTDSDTVTITVTGTNDVPTFSTGAGNDAGGVTEDATNPNLSTTGTLTVTDADGVVQSAIDPAVTPVASAGALGSLSINAAGAWTYTVANSAVQYLDAQETKTEVFTVKSVDGTSHDIMITITGANDAPVVTAITETKTENDASHVLNLLAGASDADSSDTLSVTNYSASATDGASSPNVVTIPSGALSLSGKDLTVDPTKFNYLAAGEQVVITVSYDVSDGTTTTANTATITITGANDAPVVTAITETKTENDASHVLNLLAGASDADSSDTLSVTNYSASATDGASSPNVVTIPSGALSLSGKDLTVDPTKFNYLAAGEQVVITVSYDVSDGTTTTANTATITITGANDAATFTGIDSASVTEDSNSYVKTGTLTVSDVDSPTSIVAQTNVDGAYGRFSIDSDGHWIYVADNAKLQPLNTLAEMADTFTVTTADGTVHDIVVTLDGVVDVLSISSPTAVEGTPLVFDVLLSGTTQAEQQFLFRYTGGTAVPGADFTNLPVLTPVGTGRISFDAQTGLVSVSSGVVGFHASFATQDDLVPEPVRTVDIQVEGIPSIGYISDGADMALTVENMTVNEASPYVVFRLNGVEGQQVQLSLVNFSASDVPTGSSPATIGLDTGTQIQYFDGYGWRDYAAGNQVTYPAGSTTLLVRVSLINDNVYEGPEAFKLVAVGSSIFGGGNSVVATGLGTIGDNGRGPIYNQSGAEVADAVKDDDRLLKVSSITVNEGSEYAVFSVSLGGTGSRAVSLALIEGSGSGFANIDQGQVIQYWNGAAWHDYVANATVTIPDASALLVKVDIAQESDVVYEGPETFNLNVVGAAATEYGVATIIDDGTGVIYTGAVVSGAPVTTKLGLDDDLDKDGIPPNVEEILATLSSSSGFGGNPGDLNGDGVPDAEQPAVATLAWINADYFNSALSGDLAEVRPIISMSVVSPDAQQRADAFYQLESINVVHQNDARFNGIDPAVSDVPGQTISTSWDPIVFSVAPVSGPGASLVDIDGTRAGTQIMVTIDISRSGLAEGAFNAYLKYVSQDVIAAAGGTLTDLDGQSIQKAGWYDFMQRQDANGNYHGDGARFVVKNGKIMAVQLTFTDNAFGDSNMAANMITDPGMPVHVTLEPVQPFVPAAIPKFLNLDANPEAKEKEKDKLELDQVVPRVEVKGEWATKAQFTKASLNNALLKAVEPEPAATSKALPTDRKSASGDKDSGLRNTLTPPDAVAGADGRLVYQLPQGTFTGGQGPVHLEATLKDGSPLPSWVSFDRATGRVVGHMPGGMVAPIEIKVQARDSKGNKAETVFKLKTRPDQVGFVGKQSLTAQLDNAMRWRA